METSTLQEVNPQISKEMNSVPVDYIIIAVTFFLLGCWLAHVMTKAGISALRLIDNGSRRI